MTVLYLFSDMASCEKTCSGWVDAATLQSVQDYYGKVLAKSQDLQTNVCTLNKEKIPKHVREA